MIPSVLTLVALTGCAPDSALTAAPALHLGADPASETMDANLADADAALEAIGTQAARTPVSVTSTGTLTDAPPDSPFAGGVDLNGDGYDDVAILNVGSASALLYWGSASGLASTATTVSLSALVTTGGPDKLAAAGDVNGDGYGDLLIAATEGGAGRGILYLCKGSASGTLTCTNFATGSNPAAHLGSEVAGVGDINGDGIDDIAATIFGAGVRLYRGGSTPAYLGTYTLSGHVSTGKSIGAAGDVNGDGYGDVAIGLHNRGGGGGGLGVLYGGSSGITSSVEIDGPWGTVSTSFCGTAGSMGYSVASAGDFNGDGYDDVVAGAPADLRGCGGYIYMYLGRAGGIVASPWVEINGASGSFSYVGYSLAGMGDFNGDGYDDLAATGWRGLASYTSGRASPSTSTTSSEAPIAPSGVFATGHSTMGFSEVTRAGDVNGDGYADVVTYVHSEDHSEYTWDVAYGGP